MDIIFIMAEYHEWYALWKWNGVGDEGEHVDLKYGGPDRWWLGWKRNRRACTKKSNTIIFKHDDIFKRIICFKYAQLFSSFSYVKLLQYIPMWLDLYLIHMKLAEIVDSIETQESSDVPIILKWCRRTA